MKRRLVTAAVIAVAVPVLGGQLANTSFEVDFGTHENQNVWGDFGDVLGQAYQVRAGAGGYIKKARTGDRVLLINVPMDSWNGVWQQAPWEPNTPFRFVGHHLIEDGDLPENCATFLKVEFRDGQGELLGSAEGDKYRTDTRGRWVFSLLEGVTPARTAAIRFVIIAGSNPADEGLVDRIYWDDVDAE